MPTNGRSSTRWPANISPGKPEAERRWRTLFMVGDYKQAIFGFQGTNPQEYRAHSARRSPGRAGAARPSAADQAEARAREFRDLSIDASFRSSPAVLEVVDALIGEVGHAAMGLPAPPEPARRGHDDRPGEVELWPPFDAPRPTRTSEAGEEGWVAEPARALRRRARPAGQALARRGAGRWRRPGGRCAGRHHDPGAQPRRAGLADRRAALRAGRAGGGGRPAAAGAAARGQGSARRDRASRCSRSTTSISPACWSRRWSAGARSSLSTSPTAGRARCGAQLQRAPRRARRLRRCACDACRTAARGRLSSTPARFLETCCRARSTAGASCSSGSARRRATRSRSWSQARSSSKRRKPPRSTASSPGSRAATSRSSATVGAGNAVRVMTVHGAKGLEAPIVILADATARSGARSGGTSAIDRLAARRGAAGAGAPPAQGRAASSRFAALIERARPADLEEHWRLALRRPDPRRGAAVHRRASSRSAARSPTTAGTPRRRRALDRRSARAGSRGSMVWGSRWSWRGAGRAPRRAARRPPPLEPIAAARLAAPAGARSRSARRARSRRRRSARTTMRCPPPAPEHARGGRSAGCCSTPCSSACPRSRRPSAATPALRWLERRRASPTPRARDEIVDAGAARSSTIRASPSCSARMRWPRRRSRRPCATAGSSPARSTGCCVGDRTWFA